MNLKNLTGQVEYILSTNEEARNSDIALTIFVWKRFYSGKIGGWDAQDGFNLEGTVALKDLFDLPREDNIKRVRAVFQNSKMQYLPTDQKIAEARGINEETWRKHLGYPPAPVHQI